MSVIRILIFICSTFFVFVVSRPKRKSYKVEGSLECDGYSYNDAVIAFYDYNQGRPHLCDAVRSNKNGRFHLSNCEKDESFKSLDELHFDIAHKCNTDGKTLCTSVNLGNVLWAEEGDTKIDFQLPAIELANVKNEKCAVGGLDDQN